MWKAAFRQAQQFSTKKWAATAQLGGIHASLFTRNILSHAGKAFTKKHAVLAVSGVSAASLMVTLSDKPLYSEDVAAASGSFGSDDDAYTRRGALSNNIDSLHQSIDKASAVATKALAKVTAVSIIGLSLLPGASSILQSSSTPAFIEDDVSSPSSSPSSSSSSSQRQASKAITITNSSSSNGSSLLEQTLSFFGIKVYHTYNGRTFLSFPSLNIGPTCANYVAILAINFSVFLAWRIPRFNYFMSNHFVMHPSSFGLRSAHTLVTSAFSHIAPMHFLFNMVALHSFSNALTSFSDTTYWKIYLGAAVFSNLFHVFLCRTVPNLALRLFRNSSSRMLSLASAASSTTSLAPTLGASGAVSAFLAYMVCRDPNSQFRIIFVPGFNFTGGNLLQFLVVFDTVGQVLAWTGRRFLGLAHGAHLGGYLFGYFAYQVVTAGAPPPRRAIRIDYR